MWCLSVTLFIFGIIFSIGEAKQNNNLDKIVDYDNIGEKGKSGLEWKGLDDRNNIGENEKSDVEWKGLEVQKDNINNVNSKNGEIEWRVNEDEKYSVNNYGVSIGYGEQTIGKELRVNEEEVTKDENFIRPCAFDDWECVRKFFARNSDCKPAYGPAPDPLTLAQNTIYFPFSNMTYTLIDLKVRGLSSSKIVELYLNKKTGDVVFAIQVRNLNETTPHGYFSFRRTAKESIVLTDSVTILFKELIFTAVIPKLPKLRLHLADIHVDIREAVPVALYGPKAYTSKDPTVIKSFANFLASFPTIVREGTFFQAPLFTSLFIQSNICDFGIKLTSV